VGPLRRISLKSRDSNVDSKIEREERMSQSLMHRRDFVRLSSATLVAAAATSFVPSGIGAISGAGCASPLLSVGFAEPVQGERLSVVGAGTFAAGDSRLARAGASVTVHGIRRQLAGKRDRVVHLNALFAAGEGMVPYLAWSETGSRAARVTFRVPPAEQLTLTVDHRRPNSLKGVPSADVHRYLASRDAAAGEIPKVELSDEGKGMCVLAVGGDGPKLRRGTYFLALRDSQWERTPDWASMSADPQTLTLTRFGQPAELDYLVVSVDYV
jgi:hypothetical protein